MNRSVKTLGAAMLTCSLVTSLAHAASAQQAAPATSASPAPPRPPATRARSPGAIIAGTLLVTAADGLLIGGGLASLSGRCFDYSGCDVDKKAWGPLLAGGGALVAVGAPLIGYGLSSVPLGPGEPQITRYSPEMMMFGVGLVSLAVSLDIAAGINWVFAVKTGNTVSAFGAIGMAGGSLLLGAIGAPLWAVGARKVRPGEAFDGRARFVPEVSAGLGAGALRWRF